MVQTSRELPGLSRLALSRKWSRLVRGGPTPGVSLTPALTPHNPMGSGYGGCSTLTICAQRRQQPLQLGHNFRPDAACVRWPRSNCEPRFENKLVQLPRSPRRGPFATKATLAENNAASDDDTNPPRQAGDHGVGASPVKKGANSA